MLERFIALVTVFVVVVVAAAAAVVVVVAVVCLLLFADAVAATVAFAIAIAVTRLPQCYRVRSHKSYLFAAALWTVSSSYYFCFHTDIFVKQRT